jgi:hypothetical protein
LEGSGTSSFKVEAEDCQFHLKILKQIQDLCSHDIQVVARCLKGKQFPEFERIVVPSS